MTLPRAITLVLLLLTVVQFVYFAPLLPETIATHFDAAGQPDEWTSTASYFLINMALILGMTLLFVGLASLLPRTPNEWINMPNKDYWLAPERRAATLSVLQRQVDWLGAATIALFLAMEQATIQANLAGEAPGCSLWALIGAYLLFMVVWLVRLLRWAYTPPKRDEWS